MAVTRAEKRLILSGVPEEHKEAKDGGEILSSGSWSKWLDAVLDYGRIDWEAGRWALSDGEGDLPIAVWGGEGEAPEENANPVRSGPVSRGDGERTDGGSGR